MYHYKKPKHRPGADLIVMIIWDRVLDRRAVQQAQSLRQAGFRVEFVASGTSYPKEVDGFQVHRLELVERIEGYSRMFESNIVERPVAAVRSTLGDSPANLAERLLQLPLTVTRRGPVPVLKDFFANRSLLPIVRQMYADKPVYAVQSHDLNAAWLGMKLAQFLNVPFVYDSHEIFLEQSWIYGSTRRFYQLMEPRILKAASFWMIVNELCGDWMMNYYRKRGLRISEPLVIHNSVPHWDNQERFDYFRSQLGIAPDDRIALFQGGVEAHRNLDNVVRMAAYLDSRWKLVFLGNGRLVEDCRRIAGDLLDKKVFFVPAVPQEKLLSYTASADLGLIPYAAVDLNTQFASPNKLFEYIQAALPMLANNLPYLAKKVGQVDGGWLTNFEEPRTAAQVINSLTDEQLAAKRANLLSVRYTESWEEEAKPYVERMLALGNRKVLV